MKGITTVSFNTVLTSYREFDFSAYLSSVKPIEVERILAKETLSELDFLALLSKAATPFLEQMAQKAHQQTIRQFGRTIQLFMPLYISNYCSNGCLYCGFNHSNAILRRMLSLEEIEKEAKQIAETGVGHILMLTGEAPGKTPISYLAEAVECLKRYFASVAIEIFPLDEKEYRTLRKAGADSLTLYQETYNRQVYAEVHPVGRKRDFDYRLAGPERAAQAGFRLINIGPLLGLDDPRTETFFTGIHARFLEENYLDTETAVSLPRFNPAEGDFSPKYAVDDTLYVQFICALRLLLPRSGITVSTRESDQFRDNLIPLGVTKYSAESSTRVGGYTGSEQDETPQFETTDKRSVQEVASAIIARGYQPVYKDWDHIA